MIKQIQKLEFIVEVIIFGLIVSLFAHHYFFQSFKVMTHSMEPTLVGDPKCGDRIIVKKSAYYLRQPERWNTIVFKYPHDQSQIFIKRLVGLPGEKIHIQNGDIYINDTIARKPKHITQELLYPLFGSPNYQENIDEHWEVPTEWKWQKDHFTVKTEKNSWIRYKPVIVNRYVPENNILFLHRDKYSYPVGGNEYVGELEFTISITPLSEEGFIQMEIHEGSDRFLCKISIKDKNSYLAHYTKEGETPDTKIDIAYQLQHNNKTKICFSNIDDTISLSIADKTMASINYDQKADEAPKYTFSSSFSFGVEEVNVIFSDINLMRDMYYISRRDFFGGLKTYHIPGNHYFVLGDNPPNSRDSKDWQRFYFFLKNGIHIGGDQKNFPHGTVKKFTDINGCDRNLPIEILKKSYISREDASFVPASSIIGEAYVVFWPPTRSKVIY